MPVVTGQASDTVTIADGVTLTLSGDILSRPVRAELHPGSSALASHPGRHPRHGAGPGGRQDPPATPWLAFGDAGSTRV